LAYLFRKQPEEPALDASPKVKLAYKLRTDLGKAIDRLRKCTVETVIGVSPTDCKKDTSYGTSAVFRFIHRENALGTTIDTIIS